MRRWSKWVGLVVIGAAVLVTPSAAGAGGWAVSTLDPMTAPVEGVSTTVGFTIRQHGVRAINPDGRVGISVESPSGGEQLFAGQPRGATGHYVARVRFAEPGVHRWKILQGWFAAQDLGRINVRTPAVGATVESGSSSGTTYGVPLWARVALPFLGLGCAAFAVAEALRTRRRRAQALIPT